MEVTRARDKEAANVQPKGEIREVSMGLRLEAVKGRESVPADEAFPRYAGT